MINRYIASDRRKLRIRAKIKRVSTLPRLTVHRTNKHIYAQIIDRDSGNILVSGSDIKNEHEKLAKLIEGYHLDPGSLSRLFVEAYTVGQALAQQALKKKINQVVFDRGSFKFHGRVKALCEGVKEGKIKI